MSVRLTNMAANYEGHWLIFQTVQCKICSEYDNGQMNN